MFSASGVLRLLEIPLGAYAGAAPPYPVMEAGTTRSPFLTSHFFPTPMHRFYDTTRYIGRKSRIVTYPISIWRPVGVISLEFRRNIWRRKLES